MPNRRWPSYSPKITVMTHSTDKPGFLILGVLWRVFLGYAFADVGTGSFGLHFLGSYEHDRNFVTACILIGPTVGLLVGLVLDQFLVGRYRFVVAKFMRTIIFFIMIYLFATALLMPPIHRVRE